jgi:hypothetical protein
MNTLKYHGIMLYREMVFELVKYNNFIVVPGAFSMILENEGGRQKKNL